MSLISFTNVTPDRTPTGSVLTLGSGIRYFYFLFVSPGSFVDIFLSRNMYRNEEYITRLYTPTSSTSLLTTTNVKNVWYPTTFNNGFIGLSTPVGATYINNTLTPNCRITNLIQGAAYYIETRTIYNDVGADFGLYLKSGMGVAPITYTRTETSSIPLPPLPPPPPPPTPTPTVPASPTNLVATSGTYCVSLSWTQSITATFYNIYRCGQFIGKTANTVFYDSHVVSGGHYNYTITAENANGASAQTNAVSIIPIFMFTSVVPDRTPTGISVVGVGVRYFYYLFTPLTSSVDTFMQFNGDANQTAIIGLYETTNPTTNLLNVPTTISNLDSNLIQGVFTLGTAPDPQVTVYGIRFSPIGPYKNTTSIPNCRMNNLKIVTTYIVEVVTISNAADGAYTDIGMYLKNAGSGGVHDGHNVQILYNSTSISRSLPTPYIITYDFSSTNQSNYDTLIYPNLQSFQHAKNVLENIIITSPGARKLGRTNDMLVNFVVEELPSGVLGQSSVAAWKQDSSRSPDFPYEQNISFSSGYFSNGYFTSNAMFNGAQSLNGITNTSLFNVLTHEILHGIGLLFEDSNSTTRDIGWNNFLTNVAENDPWYKGPVVGNSSALASYKENCRNSNLMRIPIEKDYGSGTAKSHWDEGNTPSSSSENRYFSTLYHPAFRLELMTGFLNKDDYLTGLTAGALKDYGYTVNMNSPYIVDYPFNLIPTVNAQSFIENNHTCVCKNNTHVIMESSYHNSMSAPYAGPQYNVVLQF